MRKFKGRLPKDKQGNPVNTPKWWDGKGKKYNRASDMRNRHDEFAVAADKTKGSIMEIGSAFGAFSMYLFGDQQYIGVEISKYLIDRARELHPATIFIHGNFLKMGQTWHEAVETIAAFQVMEHFLDLKPYLQKIQKIARSRYVFSVPRGKPKPNIIRADGHVNWWKDEKQLTEELVEASLYKNCKVDFFEGRKYHICGVMTWRKK